MRVFYKNLTVIGKNNIPKNKPVLLVANHQNGMMDPVVLCVMERNQLHWLTRSDIFKKPMVSKILHSLNMLPVYRPKDNVGDAKAKNEKIFEETYRRISAGNIIAVFPEGNHGNKKHLRSIKTGPARIAFGAEEANNFELDLQIIPIGLEYSDYVDFRSNMLINYGKAIPASQYKELYKKDAVAAVNKFRSDIKNGLSEVIIDIEDLELYPSLMALENLCLKTVREHLKLKNSHFNRYKAFKYFTEKVEELKNTKSKEIESLKSKALEYAQEVENCEIKDKYFDLQSRSTFFANLVLVLSFPLFLVGFILIGLPFLLIKRFVDKKIKDPHFKSSIKVAFGAFGYLFYFILMFVIVALTVNALTGLFVLIASFVFGFIALQYSDLYRKTKQVQKIKNLPRQNLNRLVKQREDLIPLIKEFL